MRLLVASMLATTAMAASATAQVFYPQPAATGVLPSYQTTDNLDVTVGVEAFATNWGDGYSGVSYGADVEFELSPSLSIELDGKRLDTNLGSAYEYGAGLNLHGTRGELYAAINSVTTQPNGLASRDKTWVEVGGEYIVSENLKFGFEASTTLDGAIVPYEGIYTTNALNQYR